LHIDYAVNINFEAFKETVDALGGITINREEPFEETFQWAKDGREENENWIIREIDGEEKWVFYVPEGRNLLNGSTTLYYVRSRYSTDDFDRMTRQHQVLIALKDKFLSLGVLVNPIKLYNLLDILGKNVRTDMSLANIKDVIVLANDIDLDNGNIKTKVFDNAPGGLLYHTFVNKEYVLLPEGDNWEKIQKDIRNIFE